MIRTRTLPRLLIAALAAPAALLLSGCGSVDPAELPGVYRDEDTGGEIRLDADGTFAVTDVSAENAAGTDGADLIDFHGSWELVESDMASDFVYLTIRDDGLGKIGGIQLYPDGTDSLSFRPDPDGPPSITFDRQEAA